MRRLFWVGLGAAMGVLIVRKLSQAAQKLTPQGVAQSFAAGLAELAEALRDFATDVRDAMSSQEAALREAAGLDSGSAGVERSQAPAGSSLSSQRAESG
jgi:hypothetical protein